MAQPGFYPDFSQTSFNLIFKAFDIRAAQTLPHFGHETSFMPDLIIPGDWSPSAYHNCQILVGKVSARRCDFACASYFRNNQISEIQSK